MRKPRKMNSSRIRTLSGIKKSTLILSVAGLVFGAADLVGQSTANPSGAVAASQDAKDGPAQAIPGAQMSVDILSDTQGVDFNPYFARTLKTIAKSWTALLPDETRPPYNLLQGEAIIRFTINPDGKISAMHLDPNSQQVKLDRAAWAAITSIGQFPPLPPNFSGPNLELRIHFRVNEPNANR